MRLHFALLIGVLGLAVAAPAAAGGWATAGLAPPPDDVRSGDTWTARVTVLQHGRTPLSGVAPSVAIIEEKSGARREFPARATDEPGVYEARVELPAAGTWRYTVDDGFGRVHTFAPFEVAPAADGGFPFGRLGVLAAGLALAVGAALGLARLRRTRAVPALR